jgi:hypothetical protein
MKKSTLFLATLLLISLTGCKKELSQPEAQAKITSLASQKNFSKETFEKELLPIVNELYEQDSAKYRIIHHIALKAQKEKSKGIFEVQVKNLKAEMKFVK